MTITQLKLSADISISGNAKQVAKAREILDPMLKRPEMFREEKARIIIQDAIDAHRLGASILYRGNQVWSRRKITVNLKHIMKRGQLYGNKRVRWMHIGILCLPEVEKDFKPILSEYFYNFLHLCCGSSAHYNRAGWIGIYPTLNDLKKFFIKNEFGKAVIDYIPSWKTDAKRIVEDIERMLYPLRSYIKATRKQSY